MKKRENTSFFGRALVRISGKIKKNTLFGKALLGLSFLCLVMVKWLHRGAMVAVYGL